MGKGDRRGKTRPKGIPPLAATPKRELKDGGATTRRKRTAKVLEDRNAQNVALDARARQCGLSVRDPEATDVSSEKVKHAQWNTKLRNAMRSQAMGDQAGRAIMIFAPQEEAKGLWDVYSAFLAAVITYHRVVLGKSAFAKTAKIEMAPEPVEARPEDTPDDRTEDEKHRDATNAWMKWHGAIGHLPSVRQTKIWDIAWGRREAMEGGIVTSAGVEFIKSLTLLKEVVDRK